jgi:hypothetical protein
VRASRSIGVHEHSSTRAEEYTSRGVHGMLKMSCLMCNAQCQAGEPSDMRATSVRTREKKKGRRSGVVGDGDGDGEPSAMLVQCGALPCRAVQRSAAQTQAAVNSVLRPVHMGWRLESGLAEASAECHAPQCLLRAGPKSRHPPGHLPSSLHIPARSAPCPPRLSTHTGSPPRASPVRGLPCASGQPVIGRLSPPAPPTRATHPALRFRSRGVLG